MRDSDWTRCGNHFVTCVSQFIVPYTYTVLYVNYISIKLEEKKKKKEIVERKREALPLNILWLDVATGVQFL